jgi:hypothetical protein
MERWLVPLIDGTFVAYGDLPLCLRHARQRLEGEVIRRLESFGSDVNWVIAW